MTDGTRSFLVARNPEADSRLPYLLLLPLEGGLTLKARESWPPRRVSTAIGLRAPGRKRPRSSSRPRSFFVAGGERRSTWCSIVPGFRAPSSSSRR